MVLKDSQYLDLHTRSITFLAKNKSLILGDIVLIYLNMCKYVVAPSSFNLLLT